MPFIRSLDYFQKRFHARQEDAWLAYKAGRTLVLDWGRRAGKSELIAELFIEDVETHGRDCMYVALSQKQAREIMWSKFYQRLSKYTHRWRSNESRLEWRHGPSGAIISLKGMDLGKDKLRGGGKRLIAADEFAFGRDSDVVREVFVPQLADYNGRMIYASTPKGKNHFHRLKQRAIQRPDKYFTNRCTMFENPFISDEGRAQLVAEYSGEDDPLYRQEVLAEYVVLNGLAFALPQDSYLDDRWGDADYDWAFHWRGVDHGFSPDPTASIWLAFNRRQGYWQVYNEYKRCQLLIHQHADVIQNLERWRILDTFSDVDPQLIAEYEAVGLKMTPAQKADKESRILRVVNALRTGKLKISRHCTQLLDEMQTYEWGQDGNDHLIDALIYGFTNAVVPDEVKDDRDDHPKPRAAHAAKTAQDFGESKPDAPATGDYDYDVE